MAYSGFVHTEMIFSRSPVWESAACQPGFPGAVGEADELDVAEPGALGGLGPLDLTVT